jgi:hypothetical protein
MWRAILGGLVVAAWDSARRISGQREACVAEFVGADRAPFGSLVSALEFAVYRQPLLGVTSRSPVIVQDRQRDVAARMSARAAGVDVRQPRTTFTGTGRAQGAAAVELRVDVLRAVRRSNVSAVDFWMLVASDVGELQPRARRSKSGAVEEAFARRPIGHLVGRLKEAEVDITPSELRARLDVSRQHVRAELEIRGLIPRPPRLMVIHGPSLDDLPALGSLS